MNPRDLEALLSGERQTFAAAMLRLVLSFLEPFYTIAVTTIRLLYNLRLLQVVRVSVPVISVGNITTGGTGKTPVVALVTQLLQEGGYRPGIASRGYRTLSGETGSEMANDEKLLLHQLCPEVPHLQDRDRVRVARELIREFGCDRIVLDDGFQHRRLARDLDLVLIDATNPLGYGHLLPRGLLREPLTSLGRADLLVITRVDQVTLEELAGIQETLRVFSRAPIVEMRFEAVGWIDPEGQRADLAEIPEDPVVFCGIGNPGNFRRQLEHLGVRVREERWRAFPDHHHYTETEIAELCREARASGGILLTTQKDLVKLAGRMPADVECRALRIEAVIQSGQEHLRQQLERLRSA